MHRHSAIKHTQKCVQYRGVVVIVVVKVVKIIVKRATVQATSAALQTGQRLHACFFSVEYMQMGGRCF